MSLLSLKNAHKDFGIKEILRDGTFSIEPTDKIGLIGTNGSGKSTLLKMLAGLEPIDRGDRLVNPNYRLVYLPQDPPLDSDRTVLEQVFADSGEQMALVREYEDLSHRLGHTTGPELDLVMAQLASLGDKMAAAGAWELETQAKIVLSKLGIEDFEAKVGTLSGGYRKRIALAAALLAQPDLLLMDEPTNHLDADSVNWLQDYLRQQFRGALLLVTHDRYFLDRVTNRILELDRGDLFSYAGNYGYYLEKKAEAETAENSRQRKFQGVLRRELEWLKRGPKARSTKQKARIDRIQDMRETEFKANQGKVEIATAGRRIGKKVIELEKLTYEVGDRVLIRDFTYQFLPDDRVGIIGGNGVGKSTLMNLIMGKLEPTAGQVDRGSTIQIGYFDQHSDDLSDKGDMRVLNYLKETAELVKTADGQIITASQMLERFLFPPDQQYAPISKLSGGERRRLFLLKVLLEAPNVLILDEPTNDVDVQTLAVLEEYLEEFNGCVIVVSHDRYFLDRTVEKIFAFEQAGQIRQYPGNYSVYLDLRSPDLPSDTAEKNGRSAEKKASATTTTEPDQGNSSKGRSRKLSYKEKRELEHLETHLPQWEEEKATIEKRLYENPPSGYSEVEKLSQKLADLSHQIDQGTERWLELSELAES
ncbi:ABC-F family ATP-binding cassette domain-containing protein [Limnothrix sp. FACHB-708]|uniref:ABC-F family ATP-binding cassette domain-containing protein n=1 Tax=unclassified Limnothrix TaxID=2632864 RepID=UPI0016867183|nr:MULTISPECIES: ABC-F family ATP-binding cassette domain-containing protein [unclassified Limnothrix]MBD2553404.1 ABC-F family ATP-binding cassette domain-containing protein [Limnothrix sp. FACHB-708]MBD2590444.1 ABC-F family ATP-binding cassette domain-containing protein [Limnothrix sp. FACHB-406]